LYFQDESRFGLFTRNGRMLTAKGIKPVCSFQQVFQSTDVFGAFSPITGEQFTLEMPHCNGDTFQIYLNEFSKQNPQEYKIIVLDNGAFHKTKTLIIPENIQLLFLPPYSPELNPAEKIWAQLKRKFTNQLFTSLQQVSDFIAEKIKSLDKDTVLSTCAFKYIFSTLIWTT
jgi:transposase